jgi:gamma-glutamylcyclotransferase (GGCT)/AIG2-like uncharacterized protein YtfP
LPRHLFVYGTLMSGFRNAHAALLRQSALMGPFQASVPGVLYDFGAYPGLVETDEPEASVSGELYDIGKNAGILTRLDRYEGCGPFSRKPHPYRRTIMQARLLSGGERSTWVYVYCGPAPSRLRFCPG